MSKSKTRRPAKAKSKPAVTQTEERELAELSDKQRVFVEHYLLCWNSAAAARRAGYSEHTARSIGSENLTKPNIQAAIARRIAELKMSADEVLLRLAKHARGSVEQFLDVNYEINLQVARDNDALDLVREIEQTRRTEHPRDGDPVTTVTTKLKLQDQQSALVHVGRAHAIFTDKTALTDPTGQHEYTGLTDDERMARLAALAERARTRRARRSTPDSKP